MLFSKNSVLALAAFAVGQAVATSIPHRHFHTKRAANEAVELPTKRNLLTTDAASILTTLGVKSAGINAAAPNGAVWLGPGGPYTNEFINNSTATIIAVVWGSWGSWVNAQQPLITVSLAPGQTQVVSFANGQSGGWAGIYPDTKLVNGQISETWGEYTFSNPWSTFDVSREVNMKGHVMSIEAPNCVSNFDKCVFVCDDASATSCITGYSLKNCATGSQPGAGAGTYAGAASGGCTGLGESAALKTYFL
ncbi:hypothetical protein EJ06DRAFT_536456 [Trichodelitschia bisporula]|uniref:Effector 5 n=1 Tax=Trichodelitschia bisporula TaxID=703511 RepID=A0A6G1I4N9_9PEZI|nr:hypothetical protein EJ06DRAFT_536456 [Trichodelitschia bisporula]